MRRALPMPGEIAFGRYVLLDKLAVGGMAEIFVAHATGEAGFRKACVIKRVLPHLALRPGFREMFLDEARVAARLNHPGIVQIFDLGREGDDFYIAMEYLPGEDVGTLLRRCKQAGRPIPAEVAARIVASTAEALHYAHELLDPGGRPIGIVHRDMSPSNIVVTYQGTVKVLDFGIARAEERFRETFAGKVQGKLAYMAPEQGLGRPVDRRADVWSLGVVLHELLTQERLFVRDALEDTRRALLEDPIPAPRALRPEVPEELDELTMRALERDPAKRLPNADVLRAGLERFLADRTYVPSQLGQFVRDLVGPERVRQRMQVGSGQPDAPGAPEPTPLLHSSGDSPTVIGHPSFDAPAAPPRRARRWWWAVLALAIVGGAGFAGRAVFLPPPAVLPGPAAPAAPVAPIAQAPPPKPADVAPEAAPISAPEPPPEPPASPHGAARAAEGWLSVDSNVPGQLFLDGARLGPAPLARLKVSAGEHRLKLVNPSQGVSKSVRVRVRGGATAESRLDVPMGTLNVTVEPWADVFLDGFHLGQTPLAGRAVAAGAHQLKLVNPSGEKSLKVEVPTSNTLVVREAIP